MKKKFKAKKNGKNFIYRFILFVLLGLFCFIASLMLSKVQIIKSSQQFISYILKDSNNYLTYNNKDYSFQSLFLQSLFQIDLNNPISILQQSSYYLEEPQDTLLVYNDKFESQENFSPVIKEENNLPLVYIYNTHPTETFVDDELNVHNIEPTVRAMSDVLKEKLEELGVPTVVETGDISAYLKEYNYNYNGSYTASKYFLEQFLKENSSVKLYIDLHRDGVDYQYSVATHEEKKYAKVMFVVGTGHENYQSTLSASKKINSYFEKNYPNITRGIFEINGIFYNQHITPNMILIELGGNYNQVTEVLNTIDLLAQAIKEYVYET